LVWFNTHRMHTPLTDFVKKFTATVAPQDSVESEI
jgi:hypothetical protein